MIKYNSIVFPISWAGIGVGAIFVGMAVYNAKGEEKLKLILYGMISGIGIPTGLVGIALWTKFKEIKKLSNELERKVSGTAVEE